jgi:hypothetical protein
MTDYQTFFAIVVAFIVGWLLGHREGKGDGELKAHSDEAWRRYEEKKKAEAEEAKRPPLMVPPRTHDPNEDWRFDECNNRPPDIRREIKLRDGLREIVIGWTLVDDFDELTDRIERAAEWAKENGPLTNDEALVIKRMVEMQIAMGHQAG